MENSMVRTVKKPEERRAEIIRAARTLFQTKGYDNTSMQDVMDELGIAKGTIYYYFKSKDDLLEAVVTNIVDEITAHMRSLIDQSNGNALEKIALLTKSGYLSEGDRQIVESFHSSNNSGMQVRLLGVALIKEAPIYAEVIKQGCQEGLFQTDTPLECAEFILCSFQFLTNPSIFPWAQEDLMRRARAFPALLEAQLKAPAGSFRFLFNE
jgi:AcrR family transcriptional regulator